MSWFASFAYHVLQCSAYTHVFADTLRSIAVIIAAALAELFDEVSAEEADAAAALVVSLLILLSLVPLFQGLVQSAKALWAIRAEERSEAMMDEIKAEERKRRENFWNAGRVDEWSTWCQNSGMARCILFKTPGVWYNRDCSFSWRISHPILLHKKGE